MRLSIIDIGTNTMLMLIAETGDSLSEIRTLADIQRIPRLGKGVDKSKNISGESIYKAIDLLNEYKNISKEYKSHRIIVTATSFLRDAANKSEFIRQIEKGTGLQIEILSGEDEAKWTFWGGTHDQLRITNVELRICLIDIGGGSTEISFSDELPGALTKEVILNHAVRNLSLDIGAVRLKEKFNLSQPAIKEALSSAEQYIINELNRLKYNLNPSQLIGVAGTVTTLAAIKLQLPYFDKDKIEGIEIGIDEIENIFMALSKKEIGELNKIGDYMEGRSDIIIAGTLILKTFMRRFGFTKIKVSTKGLRYGIFLREVL